MTKDVMKEWTQQNESLILASEDWVYKNAEWISLFFKQAEIVSSKSKDPRKIGAMITTSEHRVVSQGFNGFPQGVEDTLKDVFDKETNFSKVVHAEVNAILFAEGRAKGATMYVYPLPPCVRCTVQIIQAGIKRVVFKEVTDGNPRWIESYQQSFKMFKEAGVEVVPVRDLEEVLKKKRKSRRTVLKEIIRIGREILALPKLTPARVLDYMKKQDETEIRDLYEHLFTQRKAEEENSNFVSFIHGIEELVVECEKRLGLRETRVVEWIDPDVEDLPKPDYDTMFKAEDFKKTHKCVDGKHAET